MANEITRHDVITRGSYRTYSDGRMRYALVDMSGTYPRLCVLDIDDSLDTGSLLTVTSYNVPIKGHYIRKWGNRGNLHQVFISLGSACRSRGSTAVEWSDDPVADLYSLARMPKPKAARPARKDAKG